MMTEFK